MITGISRLGAVCALLTGATLLSWWIGGNHGLQRYALDAGITVGVILMAALKVRLIVWEFMELRHAPRSLRRIADATLAALIGALLLVYCFGGNVSH
ncbi:MAG TPA: cytochrome C oxidase subunit IV family protein [Fontimonas sp.]